MASPVRFPIPNTPTSVSRNDVRCALCALYAERPLLVDFDDCLGPVAGVRLGVLWAGGVLTTGASRVTGCRGIAGSVA